MAPDPPIAESYDPFYRNFDSPLMRRVREDAYGEDIGQHSWVTADELRADAQRLQLDASSRLLDLGCGPGGPLLFLLSIVGARGTGLDLSPAAIQVATVRASALGVGPRFEARTADLKAQLPDDLGTYTAVMSIDVVLHLPDRLSLFREVARVLEAGGRFLFTDAGVVTGAISADDVRRRSAHGYSQFVPEGWNEAQLHAAGLRLIEREDRTASVVRAADGRLTAFARHRAALEELSGTAWYAGQVEYLRTVRELAARRALARIAYVAEVRRRT